MHVGPFPADHHQAGFLIYLLIERAVFFTENIDFLNDILVYLKKNISENSKPGKNRGRKATGLRHLCYDSRATEEVAEFLKTVCLFGIQFFTLLRKGNEKMKKGLSLLLTAILVLSAAATPAAARENPGKSSSASAAKVTAKTSETDSTSETTSKKAAETPKEKSQKTGTKKEFKAELNTQKKELQQQKSDLNQKRETLQAQYEALLAAGDTEGAASLLKSIQELDQQIQALQAQIKEIINERFMVAKTLYTDEELAQFSSASDLIAQMYADAEVLQAGSVTVNNQIIKFDTPAYIKNGTILVPLRAIAEKVGGNVTWDDQTQTVMITKGDTVIEITPNSMTALVNGVPTEMDQPATVTCGRSYVPLQFLAKTLGLEADLDSENGTVDIDDGSAEAENDSADTSTESTTTDTTAAESTDTETTTTDTDAAQG